MAVESSHEIAYDVAMRRLDAQLQQGDAIIASTGVMLGLAGTAIGLFAGFVAVAVDTDSLASFVFATISGAIILDTYFVVLGYAWIAFGREQFDRRPNWDELLELAQSLDRATMQLWVAESCVAALKDNQPKLEQRTAAAGSATRLALVVIVLVAVALMGLFGVN